MITICSLMLLASREKVTIPPGRLDRVGMIAHEKLDTPIFIGGRGSMPEELKIDYLPEKWSLFRAVAEVLARLQISDKTITLKPLKAGKFPRGIEQGGEDLAKLFPENQFNWFLKELEVTMAFETMGRAEFLEKLKLSLGVLESKTEKGAIQWNPDPKKFRARWAATIEKGIPSRDVSPFKNSKETMRFMAVSALSDSQIRQLLYAPFTYLEVPFSNGTEFYSLAKESVGLALKESEKMGQINYENYVSYYGKVYWDYPVVFKLMVLESAHFGLPT